MSGIAASFSEYFFFYKLLFVVHPWVSCISGWRLVLTCTVRVWCGLWLCLKRCCCVARSWFVLWQRSYFLIDACRARERLSWFLFASVYDRQLDVAVDSRYSCFSMVFVTSGAVERSVFLRSPVFFPFFHCSLFFPLPFWCDLKLHSVSRRESRAERPAGGAIAGLVK